MAATEEQLENLRKGMGYITKENAREMQKRGVKSRLTRQAFVQEAMRQFHKDDRDKKTFNELATKASKGDVQALEQLRKWIMEDEDGGSKGASINLIIGSQEEKKALDKWSE